MKDLRRFVRFLFELVQGVVIEVAYSVDFDLIDDEKSLEDVLVLFIFSASSMIGFDWAWRGLPLRYYICSPPPLPI
jgi:hypothetical protein